MPTRSTAADETGRWTGAKVESSFAGFSDIIRQSLGNYDWVKEYFMKKTNVGANIGLGIALGIAIGAALGAATDNMGFWLAMGVALGAAIGGGLGAVRATKE
jgi:hypothetical protein